MKRAKLATHDSGEPEEGSAYFSSKERVQFFSSGCFLLDCALGGGWALGRIANLVGDKSTGKTLLAIEACVNYRKKFPEADIEYVETEAAFDESYAEQLGLPIDSITFPEDINTVESLFEHIEKVAAKEKPTLLIVDSMDALSDRKELERSMDEGTFGAGKAKLLSQLFRRVVRKLKKSNVTIIIVSQVRDNIGVMFGEKHTRSGGKALDFYSSQIVWLSQIKRLTKTRRKIERIIGVQVKALPKKNKVGPAYRDVEFPILFGYGVEDVVAGAEWLKKVGAPLPGDGIKLQNLDAYDASEYRKLRKQVRLAVREQWGEVEELFASKRRKY